MSAALATAVVPAFAPVAEAAPGDANGRMLQSAARNQGAVLTASQWEQLQKSHPRIAREIVAARAEYRMPVLTQAERNVLQKMSKATLANIHAGQAEKKKPNVVVTPMSSAVTPDALQKVWTWCTGAWSLGATVAPWGLIAAGAFCVLLFIPFVIAAFVFVLDFWRAKATNP